MDPPDTAYATTRDGLSIAYQVVGNGPHDLVYTPGWVSNVDLAWDLPGFASTVRALTASFRVIAFDRRGSGLSDRPTASEALALEFGVEDLRAVMDATDSRTAVLMGFEDGGMLTSMFAASYPERVTALILFAPWARLARAPDWPWGWTDEEINQWEERDARGRGSSTSPTPRGTSRSPPPVRSTMSTSSGNSLGSSARRRARGP